MDPDELFFQSDDATGYSVVETITLFAEKFQKGLISIGS